MPPTLHPPVTGMPPEVWTWLHESSPVRPHVVADVRARLDAGVRPPVEDVALAILEGSRVDGTEVDARS
jgi:hypothetical protein